MATKICTACLYVGDEKEESKGSIWITIILLFFFIIPGIIYIIWSLGGKKMCPKCDKDAMIPIGTARGKELLAQVQKYEAAEKEAQPNKLNDSALLTSLMPRLEIVGVIVLVVIAFIVVMGLFIGRETETDKTIPYTTLRSNPVSMDILVSEKVSKEQVMALTNYLKKEYEGRRMIINIFDSEEAWRNRSNENYPQKEIFKHWLGAMNLRENPDQNTILWVAEGRDH